MEINLQRLYQVNRRVILWIAFFALIYLLRPVFLLTFLTFVIAFFSYPASRFIEAKARVSRFIALFAVYAGIMTICVSLLVWISPRLTQEVGDFRKNLPVIQNNLIEMRTDLEARYERFAPLLANYLSDEQVNRLIKSFSKQMDDYLPHVATQILVMAATLFAAILFSFLILIDISRLRSQFSRLKESRIQEFVEQTAGPVIRLALVVGRAMQAQAVIALANSLLTLIGLVALGSPSLAMLTVVVFFSSFIPVIGVFISSTPIVIIALNGSGAGTAVAAVIYICLVHAVEAYLLNPLIYGKHLKLNPIFVLIILFVGHHMIGLWGMLLGVPVTYYVLHDVLGVPDPSEEGGAPEAERAKA